MAKFSIEISRTEWQFKTFDVEANSEEEAIKKAEEMAYNSTFPIGNAEYSVESIITHND